MITKSKRLLIAAAGVGLIILSISAYTVINTINTAGTPLTNNLTSNREAKQPDQNTNVQEEDTTSQVTQIPTHESRQPTPSYSQNNPSGQTPTSTPNNNAQIVEFKTNVYLPNSVVIPDLNNKTIVNKRLQSNNTYQEVVSLIQEISLDQNSLRITAANGDIFYIIGDPVYVYKVSFIDQSPQQVLNNWANEHTTQTQKYECGSPKEVSSKDNTVAKLECDSLVQREGMEGEWYPTGKVIICGVAVYPTGTVLIEPFLKPTDSTADACSRIQIQ